MKSEIARAKFSLQQPESSSTQNLGAIARSPAVFVIVLLLTSFLFACNGKASEEAATVVPVTATTSLPERVSPTATISVPAIEATPSPTVETIGDVSRSAARVPRRFEAVPTAVPTLSVTHPAPAAEEAGLPAASTASTPAGPAPQSSTVEPTPASPAGEGSQAPPNEEDAGVIPAPPCQDDLYSCSVREIEGQSPVGGTNISYLGYGYEPPPVETMVERGFFGGSEAGADIGLRGKAVPDTVRCGLYGSVYGLEHRGVLLRSLLNLAEEEPLPGRDGILEDIENSLGGLAKAYRPKFRAKYTALLDGLPFEGERNVVCFMDLLVDEYLVGDGPDRVTLSYDYLSRFLTYELAVTEFGYGGADGPSEEEYSSLIEEALTSHMDGLEDFVAGRETVALLSPLAVTGNVKVEGWMVVAQWDLQLDPEGTIEAVRYGSYPYQESVHSQPLEELAQRVIESGASDAYAEHRIPSIQHITSHYRDIGAYGDISPYDDRNDNFEPEQPPPVSSGP